MAAAVSPPLTPTEKKLQSENTELHARLEEMQETLRAIRAGEVDALVVQSPAGPQLFTLHSADAESNRVRGDILANVSDAVIAVDNEERVIYLNSAAEKQYGVTASEGLGRELREIYERRWIRPEDEVAARAALDEAGHWTGETIHVKRTGETIFVESSVSRLLAADGTPCGLFATIRDITARRAAEVALRASEERFRVLFDLGPVAIFSCDCQGLLQDYNQRAAELWGCQPKCGDSSAIHYRALPLFHRDGTSILQGEDPIAKVLQTGITVKDAEFYIERLNGSRLDISATFAPLKNEQGAITGAIIAFHDVTERRELEDALVARASELAQADRRKDEFLAMLAHELRNPLAPLRNGVELLTVAGATGEEREHAQQVLVRQIENMSRLIDDLLDVSRITKGKIELRRQPVALDAVIAAAVSMIRPSITKRGQVLSVNLPAEPVYLLADATRLEQVFGNLLGNACKYGGDGCHIDVRAERLSSHSATPEVVVSVRDDGIGIAPELLPRVFDLFVQATRSLDRAHGGLGIGLTLVQRLVELHGGIVEARSDGHGKGSEFMVRLPILTEAPAPAAPAPVVEDECPRRILIVDDNTDSARSLAMIQRRRGHEARTAFSGPDAVALAAEFLPEIVLLDIGLPGMDGLEVARRLRAMPALNGVFLIAMTGYGRDEDRAEARLAGFDEYMVKPIDLDGLRECLGKRPQVG